VRGLNLRRAKSQKEILRLETFWKFPFGFHANTSGARRV
jgi:hypothetical protein